MQYLFYILLGLLPSLIWLCFYLRKDAHPEPKSMVIKIFIWGMLVAPLAVILEILLIWLLNPGLNPLEILSQNFQTGFLRVILAATLIPALVEESLKYSVVRFKVLKNSEFDEPCDTMIYSIIAGLGFASVENLIILFKSLNFAQAMSTLIFRFLGATLVHALASAIIGYFLALGLLYLHQRKKLVLVGLALAIIFHACYNYFILTAFEQSSPNQRLILVGLVAVLLITTALFISACFKKLKNQQSICKI